MIKFDEIKNIIEPELKVFNELYEKELSSSNDLLNKVLKYVAKGEGKKIRPILTILSARMVDVDASIEETCYSAVALEYLHTSSLVHDDVIDEATDEAKEIEELIVQRATAKKNKDYALADKIRNDLKDRGILLEDGVDGTTWKKV